MNLPPPALLAAGASPRWLGCICTLLMSGCREGGEGEGISASAHQRCTACKRTSPAQSTTALTCSAGAGSAAFAANCRSVGGQVECWMQVAYRLVPAISGIPALPREALPHTALHALTSPY